MVQKITCAGLALAAVLLAAGCPPYDSNCRVYYDGHGNTEGQPPVDNRVYKTGDTAIVMHNPADMKNGEHEFGGWRRREWGDIYQPGQHLVIDYGNIEFDAVWKGVSPFKYEEGPLHGEVTITGYDAYGGEYITRLDIPKTLDGKTVTRIGDYVFKDKYLFELSLPDTITHIGNSAFSSVGGLNHLALPAIQEIGASAFENCGISALDLGQNLTSIGAYAFSGNSLQTVALPQGLRSIGIYAFRGNNILVVILPPDLRTVDTGVFANNPVTVIEIGQDVAIERDNSLGNYGASFKDYYASKGKAAGIYRYGGAVWKGPAQDME